MRTDKLSWRGCLGAAVVVATVLSMQAPAHTVAAEKPAPAAAKVDPIFGQVPEYLPDLVAPQGDTDDDAGLRDGFPFDCYELAGIDGAASFRDRMFLIGNRIHLYGPRLLKKIKPVLQIDDGDQVEIAFVVYSKEVGEGFWTKRAQENVTFTGDGTVKFYSSPELDVLLDPGAIDPNPDRVFLVGFAWVDDSLRFWRRTQGSQPFVFDPEVGEVWGSVVESITSLTLLDTWVMINRFDRYAMDICFDPLPGACCDGDVCLDDFTRIDCQNLGGQYTAGGVTCRDFGSECPLPTGACCFEGTGEPCFDLNEYACHEEDGVFIGLSSSCAVEACNPRGACCIFHLSECRLLSEEECDELDLYGRNIWTEDATCDDVTCPAIGACCSVTGDACTDTVTMAECLDSGGLWQGEGVPCDPSPCALWHRGACCMFDGTCEPNLSPYACEEVYRGTYHGDGSQCGALPCVERRACCVQRACFEFEEDVCDAVAGVWGDPGERCDGNPCMGPVRSCCVDGECIMINQNDCEAGGGTWIGGDSCDPSPCTGVGACCDGPTGCTLTAEADCATGDFLGLGTTCFECSVGACCSPGYECSMTRRADCTGLDEFQGEFTECVWNRCGECDGFAGDVLGDWDGDGLTTLVDFVADIEAGEDPPPPEGAFSVCFEADVPSARCICAFDFDLNDTLDMRDFAAFQQVFETP